MRTSVEMNVILLLQLPPAAARSVLCWPSGRATKRLNNRQTHTRGTLKLHAAPRLRLDTENNIIVEISASVKQAGEAMSIESICRHKTSCLRRSSGFVKRSRNDLSCIGCCDPENSTADRPTCKFHGAL